MTITSIKTAPITSSQPLTKLIDQYVPRLKEQSVLAITSKIVSICEGRVVPSNKAEKDELVKKEAEWYLPRTSSKYNVMLTIKNKIIIAAAGIDESNSNGHYVLWPKDPYATAALVWSHLLQRDALTQLGVIITDSRNTPTRWGAIGVGIAYCGFQPVNSLIGTPDIFGRTLVMTKVAMLDGLAAAAVLVMGEGNQQTPLAVLEQIPEIVFQDHPPTAEEKASLQIEIEDDLYEPFLTKVPWLKGGENQSS